MRRMPPHLVGVGAYQDHNSKGYPHRQGKRDGMQIGAYKNECTDLLGLRVSLPSWWVCKRLLLLGVWPNLVALDSISTNCRLLMQPYGFYSAQMRILLGPTEFWTLAVFASFEKRGGLGVRPLWGEGNHMQSIRGFAPIPPPAIALLLSLRDGGVLVKKSVYIWPLPPGWWSTKKEFVFCCYFVPYFCFEFIATIWRHYSEFGQFSGLMRSCELPTPRPRSPQGASCGGAWGYYISAFSK
jgi:hypothetical protein